MKITNEQLKQIITEEVQRALKEETNAQFRSRRYGGQTPGIRQLARATRFGREEDDPYDDWEKRLMPSLKAAGGIGGATAVALKLAATVLPGAKAALGAGLGLVSSGAALVGLTTGAAALAGEYINRHFLGVSIVDAKQLPSLIEDALKNKPASMATARKGCTRLNAELQKADALAKKYKKDPAKLIKALEKIALPPQDRLKVAAALAASGKYQRAMGPNGLPEYVKCRKLVGLDAK